MKYQKCAVSLGLFLVACSSQQVATQPSSGSEIAEPQVTFDAALATAQNKYPDLVAIEVERETKEGRHLIEVELMSDSAVQELYLDAYDGSVVKEVAKKEKAEVVSALYKQIEETKAGLGQALAFAQEKYTGENILEVELELREGALVWTVEVERDGKKLKQLHDPATGKVLARNPEQAKTDSAAVATTN